MDYVFDDIGTSKDSIDINLRRSSDESHGVSMRVPAVVSNSAMMNVCIEYVWFVFIDVQMNVFTYWR